MDKCRFCVGVDVGKDELVVAIGERSPRVFGTSVVEIRRLARWVLSRAGERPVHLGMEATGVYSHGVAAELSLERRFCVSVINPAQIKALARARLIRTKTDAVDAEVIRDFVRSQSPPAWRPLQPVRQELLALVAQATAISRGIRQWQNRRHAQQHDLAVPEAVTGSTATIIALLEAELANLQEAIAQLSATDRELAEDMELLISIKGIAGRSAAQILAYGGDKLTTRTRRQLDAHAGLAPSERQSGTSVRGKSHLAKQGDANLRRVLYMPTLVAVQFNPVLKQFYQRLLEKGKAKKVALTACMRKLLNIIRSMLIKRKPFDPNYQPLT